MRIYILILALGLMISGCTFYASVHRERVLDEFGIATDTISLTTSMDMEEKNQ